MSLRAAQVSLFILNIASMLAAVAALLVAWEEERAIAWLALAALIAVTLLARISPLFYMAGVVAGPGLLAYAVSDDWLVGVITSGAITLAFYLFTWHVRKDEQSPR